MQFNATYPATDITLSVPYGTMFIMDTKLY